MNAKKKTTPKTPAKMKAAKPASANAKHLAAVMETARQRLGLETLETRGRDSLDFHDLSVASLRDIIRFAFAAGLVAASGAPAPEVFDPKDPGAMLDTLEITRTARHQMGGTWVNGTIAGHAFEALVFPEHAESPAYELADSRISKLWLRDTVAGAVVATFDRGWDRQPSTPAAKAIVDLLATGLAELIFNR